MRAWRILLRWSWRDLRTHWAKVVAIALVMAIGTGGYAGLTSTAEWRRVSYDLSYRQLAMYDLRVNLATGSTVEEGLLTSALDGMPDAALIAAVEERLIIPVQVDASTPEDTILVRGEITGSDFSDGMPEVNGYHPIKGRLLTQDDAHQPLVMLDPSFARFYEVPPTGTITISGDRRLEFVGHATTPEYFSVAPEGEMFMTEATFAGMFTTLETAQDLAGLEGRVNNLILTLAPGTDRDSVQAQMETALAGVAVGTTVLTRDDNLSYTALTTDVDQDQAMFNALAVLLFAGAAGAAFNLIHRLAEQQRREIGIGMALGVRPRVLAFRPLLVSAQIALLGVVLGVLVGVWIGNAMGAIFEEFVPLPQWVTEFQAGIFARVAVIGLLVPFVASAIPVVRAVRVSPIEAIRPELTGRGVAFGGTRRTRNTFNAMPLRNLRRTPRRTVLTVLGISAAVTVLAGFLGIMDSVFGAVDTAETESAAAAPERISVGLDTFRLSDSPEVTTIGKTDAIAVAEPSLHVAGTARSGTEEIDVFIGIYDLADGMWRPTLTEGALGDGLILTEKAARDLGVRVGETVNLRHPVRVGTSYTFTDSDVTVVATHPHPVRSIVYMDMTQAALFNLEGISNGLNVLPATGFTTADVQRALFEFDHVASAQSVTAVTQAVRDAFQQMLGIIQVMVSIILVLALLIAFNTASINLDSRAREHATMFAFGVKVRTAARMAITESFIIGVIATVVGIAGGLAMIWWMTQVLLARTLPDFDLNVIMELRTIGLVAGLGVIAVTVAPLLTVRRMRRLDLPGTLRLVE